MKNQQRYLLSMQHLYKFAGMSLGERIRYYRNKLGWTLEDLSERSGVEVGTISALEVRKSKRSEKGIAIAKAFGLTAEQLQDDVDHLNFANFEATIRRQFMDDPSGMGATDEEIDSHRPNIAPAKIKSIPARVDPTIAEVISLMEATDETGRKLALGGVKAALSGYSPGAQRKQGL